MADIDGNFVITLLALIANLITIIKYTSALEKRLTTLETTIEKAIEPRLNNIDAMISVLYGKLGDNVRKEDLQHLINERKHHA